MRVLVLGARPSRYENGLCNPSSHFVHAKHGPQHGRRKQVRRTLAPQGREWRTLYDERASALTGGFLGLYAAPLLGMNWNNSANCGSRSSNWNNSALALNANYGARGASDTSGIYSSRVETRTAGHIGHPEKGKYTTGWPLEIVWRQNLRRGFYEKVRAAI